MALIKIGWGQRQDGQFIHVTEAERGKKCNCRCPECNTPLIARQGEVTAWHFAHAQPVECYGESVLHKVAKQIIVDVVDTSKTFLVPSQKEELSDFDLTAKACITSWQIPEKSVLLDSAEEEKRFKNGQVTDVLVGSSSLDCTLAIEIFVTHKKSELDVQKFSEITQDVIEVDLSGVDPLVDRNTLEEQVLLKADRYWLFNQEEIKQQEIHKEKLKKLNQSYFTEMIELVTPAVQKGDLAQLKFMWPQLTKQAFKKGLFGQPLAGNAIKTPKITKLNVSNSFSIEKYGCLTDAIVGKKVLVDVCFTLLDTELPLINKSKPLLIFEYNPGEQEFYLTWLNIQKWEQRLTELAQKDLNSKLLAEQEKYKQQTAYAKRFAEKTDLERVRFLANELSLSAPHNAGQYLDHWNTSWHIWKTLVWKYKIVRKQGGIIDVEHISTDDWFEQLLNWPKTEAAQVQRSKNIWFWFSRDLEKLGIVEHIGHMLFKVSSSLPKKFVPWAKR